MKNEIIKRTKVKYKNSYFTLTRLSKIRESIFYFGDIVDINKLAQNLNDIIRKTYTTSTCAKNAQVEKTSICKNFLQVLQEI